MDFKRTGSDMIDLLLRDLHGGTEKLTNFSVRRSDFPANLEPSAFRTEV
jgi:hypothetical protein